MKQETGTQEILHEAEKQHAMAGVPEETREAVIQAQHEFFERQWGEVRCAANERTAATVDIGPCHIQKWAAHHIQAAGVQVATDDAQYCWGHGIFVVPARANSISTLRVLGCGLGIIAS